MKIDHLQIKKQTLKYLIPEKKNKKYIPLSKRQDKLTLHYGYKTT